jgi:hypothetical protein
MRKDKKKSAYRRRGLLTGNRRMGHGARGEEEDDGGEENGEGEVAVRKLHDSMEMGRGKEERRREERGTG